MSPRWRLWSLILAGLLVFAACTSRAESGGETTSTSLASTTTVSTTTAESTATSTVPSGSPSYLVYGWEGVMRVEGGVTTRLTVEPVWSAWENGAGGVAAVTTGPTGVGWLGGGPSRGYFSLDRVEMTTHSGHKEGHLLGAMATGERRSCVPRGD